jgi:hypothetical protein
MAQAELTMAQALDCIRDELGITDCPKPRQAVERACSTLSLGFEPGETLRQQVQGICEFLDIQTNWQPNATPPPSSAPAAATAAQPSARSEPAEEGVPPEQHSAATASGTAAALGAAGGTAAAPADSVAGAAYITPLPTPGAATSQVAAAAQAAPEPEPEVAADGRASASASDPESSSRVSRGSAGPVVSQEIIDTIDQAIEQADKLQPYSCRVTGAEVVRGSSTFGGGQHTEYQIELLWGPQDGPHQLIRTSKRYSEFVTLDKSLRPLLGPDTIPKLPKKSFNKNGQNVVRQRMELLKEYLDSATRQVARMPAYMQQSRTAKDLIDTFLNATVLQLSIDADGGGPPSPPTDADADAEATTDAPDAAAVGGGGAAAAEGGALVGIASSDGAR